ncbi:G-type lectin S-receptor-like serine/threonine-protein kinase LECRK3 [Camellia lanceoleosa]|uniref:G-type lectin S-receptor-like serine/threonine-protein kinase LECRK3 n=1 Tax=Camellia lanceoleosa TaxID=1840588 RepID=A0ACC0FIX1_9ERIC|nr:G-type lectin S-receptor-like serine/threonine-protein kinase LECRK3 [Camellia lanceoleosa]
MASSAMCHLLLLSFLPILPVFGVSYISLGKSLSAIGDNSSWISPSGDFAFGFRPLNNTNIFLLAIWFARIPERTIVWHANTASPVRTNSTVKLTAEGLTLKNCKDQTIWKAQPKTTISYAVMLDTGNFVLVSTNSVFEWQSFNYPTDTILPTQNLSLGSFLYSRLTETNYSRGRFALHFKNGELHLQPVSWPSKFLYPLYYKTGIASGFQLVFSKSANIYIAKWNGEAVQLSWHNIVLDNPSNYYRATMDFDGFFRQYIYLNTSVTDQGWSVLRYIPDNICNMVDGYSSGVCGVNGICEENSGLPSCHCPPGFSFIDPDDKFGGCKPNFTLGCGVNDGSRNPEDLYDLKFISGLNFPFGDYEVFEPENQKMCEQSCLHDCSCTVAIFGGKRCWKKKMPLSYGRLEGGHTMCIIKIRKHVDDPDAPPSNSMKDLFGRYGFITILLLVAVYFHVFLRWQETTRHLAVE